jgi:CelD/BcsL family acetyltransferase involved in cellulose biosynthesis
MLPLYVYADRERNERQLLLLGAGTSDYLDGLFTPASTAADLLNALATLAEQNTWDVLHITQLLPHSLFHEAFAQLDPVMIHRYPGESCSRCPALPIRELPRKVRFEVRYFRNAAGGRGKLRMDIADASSWQRSFEALINLHSARWQASNQAGVLSDPDVLAWHHEAIPLLQAADCLRLYVLYLDSEAIAALYALVDPPTRPLRTEYFYLIGYSPAHAHLKPGTLLTAMASEQATGAGVQVIDMLRGSETYKKFWHVEEVATSGFSIPRTSLVQGSSL